jgi:hypothetical protein
MNRIAVLPLVSMLVVAAACKKDESKLPEKIALYQLLCPAGIDACYNDCGTSSGVSSGTVTGEELRAFNTCTSRCDILCDTSFLLLAQ